LDLEKVFQNQPEIAKSYLKPDWDR